MFSHFRSLLVLCLSLLRALLVLIRVLGHDVLKVTPERLYGRELGADLSNFFQGAVELVDVLED